MTRLTIDLPEDLRRKVEAHAAESGHPSVEQYVQDLLLADADGVEEADSGGPDHLTVGSQDELESLLLRRLEDSGPGVEATPEFWRGLKGRMNQHRINRGRAGQ